MFKVVADQLKVSQGWVRCGHCANVFDGSAHLLPDGAPVAEPTPATQTEKAGEASRAPAEAESESDPAQPAWAPARSFADREPLMPVLSGPDGAQESAADFDPARWKQAQKRRQQHEAAPLPDGAPSIDLTERRSSPVQTKDVDESGIEPSGMADSEAAPEVSFVRDARRTLFWKKPLIRWLLGVLSLVLLVTLVLQGVIQQKDSLAVLEPRLAPALQILCRYLHCEIRPPRHIESLVIDNSTFNRIGPDAYRLSFTLKNTQAMALEIPAMEVTLTDSQDRAVVRRVLTPAQFGASLNALAGHSELVGIVTMKVSGSADGGVNPSQPPAPLRVAGYRILAFYP